MASIILKDASLTVNSVDLSTFIEQVALNLSKDMPPSTTMGDNSLEFLPDGMKDASFDVTFKGDYAPSQVDDTLWDIFSGTATVTFELLPNGSSVSTSNPKFSGSCLLGNYSPITGSVGDMATVPSSFQVTGDVTRATA